MSLFKFGLTPAQQAADAQKQIELYTQLADSEGWKLFESRLNEDIAGIMASMGQASSAAYTAETALKNTVALAVLTKTRDLPKESIRLLMAALAPKNE